ncbi:hypothetical protein BVG16_29420 [Paenibacillus selenitireducens]|uniref:Uncharacterized protein n=1 Tax=Paenibacillus selenitireducens TaxID=1324314 RepID=A0A1T2X0K3_9BACL|nr:ROK family protein [Paenibacillus selenitireducens]OPA73325.1 hypothetical protein BVG16_29420 [Paenibacillus selenitireducens]
MTYNNVIALDVGGTFIKTCIVENGVPLKSSYKQFPALADRDAATIINQFMTIIKIQYESYNLTKEIHPNIRWQIGIAFPGPFDYSQGISYVHGLNKFESIYGINLKKAFYAHLENIHEEWAQHLLHVHIRFENDARLFALGMSTLYPSDRIIALTLGTGLGSAFIDHSNIINHGPGVPENGWLYNQPFRGGRIDDLFSRRGILQMAQHAGVLTPEMDVKDLADSAKAGNVACMDVFSEFGMLLAEMLLPYILSYQPTIIILGGQIAKSYDLFKAPLLQQLGSTGVQIIVSDNLIDYTFIGIFRMFHA